MDRIKVDIPQWMLKLNLMVVCLRNSKKMAIDGGFKDDIGCVIMIIYLFISPN